VTVADAPGSRAGSVPPPERIVYAAAPAPVGLSTVTSRLVLPLPEFVIVKLLTSELVAPGKTSFLKVNPAGLTARRLKLGGAFAASRSLSCDLASEPKGNTPTTSASVRRIKRAVNFRILAITPACRRFRQSMLHQVIFYCNRFDDGILTHTYELNTASRDERFGFYCTGTKVTSPLVRLTELSTLCVAIGSRFAVSKPSMSTIAR
jgi:hypothetical protein